MKPGLVAVSWLVAGGALIAAACTHYVGRGSDLYYQGRYIEAAHVLENSEQRLPGASHLEQATYGLYRGATLLRLGDLAGAMRWLEYSQRLQATYPGVLRADELELLQETMIALRADLNRRAAAGGY